MTFPIVFPSMNAGLTTETTLFLLVNGVSLFSFSVLLEDLRICILNTFSTKRIYYILLVIGERFLSN